MDSPSLSEFVTQARNARRIRFGDLRRLQRDILPAGIAGRDEAEMLINLDGAVSTTDPDWADFLIRVVRDFVVSGEPPIGVVDGQKADWLSSTLSRGGLTKTRRAIAREIARHAEQVDERFLALAGLSVQPGRGRDTNDGRAIPPPSRDLQFKT